MIYEFFMSYGFRSGFGIFTGVVAGALIQHCLNYLNHRRQVKIAFSVMKVEIEYNQSQVQELLRHIERLRQKISANQVSEHDLFIPMQKFDYSSIGPLSSAGYFHIFLGSQKLRSYLDFFHFFQNQNAQNLNSLLLADHKAGRSLEFLSWLEEKCKTLSKGLDPIQSARLSGNKLIP